jgi:hypothetical protein
MSRYLEIDDNEPAFLASNAGWSDFIGWFDAAPDEDRAACPNLAQLIESGTCDDPSACNEEVSQLISAHEPDDDTMAVAETLMELLADAESQTEISLVA